MERVLITGGAGYIGFSLVEKLVSNPDIKEVLVYDNLSNSKYGIFNQSLFSQHDKLKFIHGDILDERNLLQNLESIDTVFHLAAKVDEPERDTSSHTYQQINKWGSSVLANAVAKT